MTTTIVYPSTQIVPKRYLLEPLKYFVNEAILTVFRVVVKVDKGEDKVFEQMHLIKLGGNVFLNPRTTHRFRFKGQPSGTHALEALEDLKGKTPLYVYEVYKCDSILTINKEINLVRQTY